MNTRSPAFSALIDRLVALQPRFGYSTPDQLGDLTSAEVSVVLRHEPTILADAMVGDRRATTLTGLLADQQFCTIERAATLSASFLSFVTEQVKIYLLDEVQAEIARDEEKRQADEAEEYHSGRRGILA